MGPYLSRGRDISSHCSYVRPFQHLVTIDSQVKSQVAPKLGKPCSGTARGQQGVEWGSLTAAGARVFRFAHPASNITEPCRPAPKSLQFRPLTTLERVACEGWGWGLSCTRSSETCNDTCFDVACVESSPSSSVAGTRPPSAALPFHTSMAHFYTRSRGKPQALTSTHLPASIPPAAVCLCEKKHLEAEGRDATRTCEQDLDGLQR
jgi:hypothetical protein